jgi:hypothetical protein
MKFNEIREDVKHMQTKFQPIPTVDIRAKKGGYVTGSIVKMGREVKVGPDKSWIYYVYELAIEDTNLPTTLRNKVGKYVDVNVLEGDVVAVWANKGLHKMLSVFDVGVSVTIKNDGKTDIGDGKHRNDYSVKMNKAWK